MYNIPKLMKHNEISAKRKIHRLTKEIRALSYQKFKSTPKSFRTKRSRHIQKK